MPKEIRAYNTKIIETSTYIEIYQYEEPIFYSRHIEEKLDSKQLDWLDDDNKRRTFEQLTNNEKYDSLKRKQRHYEDMRWEIARIVDCNFDNGTKFVTLTFRENIQDIEFANNEFKKFIQRLNRWLKKRNQKAHAHYIATWEKQARGAIHYHVVFFSLGYIKNSELANIWRNGHVKINRVDVSSKENRGRYLSKYFAKDLELKEHKKKAFFKSQNLKMPYIRKTTMTQPFDFSNETIIYSKEYNRKILDFEGFDGQHSVFKTGTVHYTKILKE